MRTKRHGAGALGMALLAVLGAMAFGAVGAQGQLPGESTLGSITINGGAALSASLAGEGGPESFLVPGRNLKLLCKEVHVLGTIHGGPFGTILGKTTYLGCLSLSLQTGHPLPCELTNLETILVEATGLPILHGSQTFVLLDEKNGGNNFTTISYKEGTECPLPLNNPLTGTISAEVSELEGVSPTLTFSPAIQLLTGDVLRFGGFPAYIHGSVDLELTGSHEGQKLGIH